MVVSCQGDTCELKGDVKIAKALARQEFFELADIAATADSGRIEPLRLPWLVAGLVPATDHSWTVLQISWGARTSTATTPR